MPRRSVDRPETLLLDINGGTVERAGTCAEGDHCTRYHCTACGEYWLSDPAHACKGGTPSRADLEQTICNWMDQQLRLGDDITTGSAKVLKRVKRAGLGDALLDAFGDRLIADLWREHLGGHDAEDANQVEAAANVRAGAQAQPRLTHSRVNGARGSALRSTVVTTTSRPHGTRRVDVDQLGTETALLESLVQVEGQWVRFGDLDRHQCHALQRKYEAEAGVARARALAFKRLAAELDEGQTVRDRWTAEQLEELIGDTLSGGAPALPEQI